MERKNVTRYENLRPAGRQSPVLEEARKRSVEQRKSGEEWKEREEGKRSEKQTKGSHPCYPRRFAWGLDGTGAI